jgi:competence protein ComEA
MNKLAVRCAVLFGAAFIVIGLYGLSGGSVDRELLTEEPAVSAGISAGAAEEEADAAAERMSAAGQDGHLPADESAGVQAEEMSAAGQEGRPSAKENAETAARRTEEICVYICGAVKNAGVYCFPEGARIYQAVEAAGGFADDADTAAVNQAERMTDGEKIRIPTLEETSGEDTSLAGTASASGNWTEHASGTSAAANGGGGSAAKGTSIQGKGYITGGAAQDASPSGAQKVNLNTASMEELMTIRGVGETRARAIIEYRQQQGGFQTTEEICRISGIGEKSYEKMKEQICVE